MATCRAVALLLLLVALTSCHGVRVAAMGFLSESGAAMTGRTVALAMAEEEQAAQEREQRRVQRSMTPYDAASADDQEGNTRRSNLASAPFGISYHQGRVLKATLVINIIWYGTLWTNTQKQIILDSINSFGNVISASPSMRQWWHINSDYYQFEGLPVTNAISAGTQVSNPVSTPITTYGQVQDLITNFYSQKLLIPDRTRIILVLASSDVQVTGMCSQFCGYHQNFMWNGTLDTIYAIAGDPMQCSSVCAPQLDSTTPVYAGKPPNGDATADGMVNTVANLLAGAATDPDTGTGPYGWYDETTLMEGPTYCQYQFGTVAVCNSGCGQECNYVCDGRAFTNYGINGRQFLVQTNYWPTSAQCANHV